MIQPGDQGQMLAGVKVVDLTSVVFGPYCTQILSDLGADVIKIEAPVGGDSLRWSAKAAKTPGMSPGFMAFNRGKQSVALDLKNADDIALVRELLADADVFVLNVRGKAVERLGLDYASVKAINTNIIYAHCVGFGQDGPYADLQAYDDIIQAATGATTLLPRVDGNPQPRYLPSFLADKVSGLHAAYAVLAAIIHKMRTGQGQFLEVPMFEVFTNFMLLEHFGGLMFDPPNAPAGYYRQIDPERQPFPTSDGYMSIAVYSDDAWLRVFDLLEAPEVLNDERFADRKLRSRNYAALYQAMKRLTPNFTTADLLERCRAAQIPAMPVRDLNDVMADPHLAATNYFEPKVHPSEGKYFEMKPPVRFSASPEKSSRPAPLLGEHTDDLRSAIGKKS